MKKNNYYQHGDVILKRIENIPQGIKKESINNRIVLADGENTGHAHAISETKKAELFKDGSIIYLKVDQPVKLKHEEHKTIIIEPGNYEIDRVKEYDPFEKEIRRVPD